MARNIVRRSLRGGVRSTRTVRWLQSAISTSASSLAASAIVLDQAFAEAQIAAIGDFTITRIRGLLAAIELLTERLTVVRLDRSGSVSGTVEVEENYG